MGHFVKLLTVFAFLLSLNAGAVYSPGQQYIVACGQQIPIPTAAGANTIINLSCHTTSNNICTFAKSGATGGYQVTSGKTLHIFASCANAGSSATNAGFNLGYGTTNVGNDSSSNPTSPVFYVGSSSSSPYMINTEVYGSINPVMQIDWPVPAGDYPFANTSGSVAPFAWAWEQ